MRTGDMRRVIAAVALVAAIVGTQLDGAALAGEVTCCLCSQCATGPTECRLPPISCDITCAQAGCGSFTLGGMEPCNALEPCAAAAPITAPAPAVGTFGVAAVAALLAAIGIVRLRRRRA